jgi:hypothetical protein
MARTLFSYLGLHAAMVGLAVAAADKLATATVRVPSLLAIEGATVTVLKNEPSITAYVFHAQQSNIGTASYSVIEESNRFELQMSMTIDGVLGNDTEYHQTVTMVQKCDITSNMANTTYLDPCTVVGTMTTGTITKSMSSIASLGPAQFSKLPKPSQLQLILDTVEAVNGTFVDISTITPTASKSCSFKACPYC